MLIQKEMYDDHVRELKAICEYFTNEGLTCEIFDNPEETPLPALCILIDEKGDLLYAAHILLVPYGDQVLQENKLFQFATDLNVEITPENEDDINALINYANSFSLFGNLMMVDGVVHFKYTYPSPKILVVPNVILCEFFALYISASKYYVDVFYEMTTGELTLQEACEKLTQLLEQ